jgi:hypothetical protein
MSDIIVSTLPDGNEAVAEMAESLRYLAEAEWDERNDEVPASDLPEMCTIRRRPRERLNALSQRLAEARPKLVFSNPRAAVAGPRLPNEAVAPETPSRSKAATMTATTRSVRRETVPIPGTLTLISTSRGTSARLVVLGTR